MSMCAFGNRGNGFPGNRGMMRKRSTWGTESAKVLRANLWMNLDEYKLSRQHAVTASPLKLHLEKQRQGGHC